MAAGTRNAPPSADQEANVSAMRPLYIALALGAITTPALAQFTSTITAPRQEPAAVAKARADSLRRTDSASVSERMTAMREWVDSAAASVSVAAPRDSTVQITTTVQDSTLRDTTVSTGAVTTEVDTTRSQTTVTTEFRQGAPAPATATPLPALALLGLGSIVAGLALRRRPSRDRSSGN